MATKLTFTLFTLSSLNLVAIYLMARFMFKRIGEHEKYIFSLAKRANPEATLPVPLEVRKKAEKKGEKKSRAYHPKKDLDQVMRGNIVDFW